ncbi:MAG: hypothetical protein ACJAR3_001874, partial [Roseivirga sp.]
PDLLGREEYLIIIILNYESNESAFNPWLFYRGG